MTTPARPSSSQPPPIEAAAAPTDPATHTPSVEPLSQTRFVPQADGFEQEPVTERTVTYGDPPSAWLDQLLTLACDLPVEAGIEAVGWHLVRAVAARLPRTGVGLSIVTFAEEHDGDKPGGPIVIRQPHDNGGSYHGGSAPLFADFAHERVFPISGRPAGSRLHMAADDPALLGDKTPLVAFATRVASVAGRGLMTARAIAEAERASGGLKAQVIQSEKLASLGQIAAGVVHELNNPLTSIIGYSDYLLKKSEAESADPEDIERLARISEAAHRIQAFSRDLMTYARPSIEAPAPLSIHIVIDQALGFCEHLLDGAKVRVDRLFGAGVAPVFGVRGQLTQVFVNLFTNASHAMEELGGRLSITTDEPGQGMVRVVVTDTGHGIAPEHLSRIFEPFFTTKEQAGTGLGLSIVRSIVISHRGRIEVESAPGGGTTFIIELPH